MSEQPRKESRGQLFVISAPSGAGKTSLVRALMEPSNTIGVAISHTTRAKRPEETDGINYHFVTEVEFNALVDRGEFLESATVFEHLYGTSTSAVNLILQQGKHLVLEIDWQGAAQVRQKLPGTQSIFIFPPSLGALRDRLENRGQDDVETVDKRMSAAFEELSHWHEFDYLIVNDQFDTALAQLQAVVAGEGAGYHRNRQSKALGQLIENLLPQ
ncbi:MAG: guanylate kinase [Gammaproteobacteria bacterium]|nr:guanylate kinase [Gammaproteobacteria bacterium]MBT6890849.1 guanylate kinase [Gammaproteobacteria bacterium]